MSPVVLQLAPVCADAFYVACDDRDRWATLPEFKRVTFRQMTADALDAARLQRRGGVELNMLVARALSDAFLNRADCPDWLRRRYDWFTGYGREHARPIWLATAEALIAAGRELRARQHAARAA